MWDGASDGDTILRRIEMDGRVQCLHATVEVVAGCCSIVVCLLIDKNRTKLM